MKTRHISFRTGPSIFAHGFRDFSDLFNLTREKRNACLLQHVRRPPTRVHISVYSVEKTQEKLFAVPTRPGETTFGCTRDNTSRSPRRILGSWILLYGIGVACNIDNPFSFDPVSASPKSVFYARRNSLHTHAHTHTRAFRFTIRSSDRIRRINVNDYGYAPFSLPTGNGSVWNSYWIVEGSWRN